MNENKPGPRTKVLFVCAQNKIRSYTAEKMFAGSSLYDVKSRGVAREARVKLRAADLRWADLIFVMEKDHKNRIAKEFREELAGKKIVVLFIEDIYQPMEESLLAILRQQLAPHLLLPEK
jgi:protein-tyrosine phosphatase